MCLFLAKADCLGKSGLPQHHTAFIWHQMAEIERYDIAGALRTLKQAVMICWISHTASEKWAAFLNA